MIARKRRFWRSARSPGRPPGAILGPKMVPRRHFFGACWRLVRTSSEVNKTLHWLTKIEVRPSFDRTKKRRNFDAEAVRTRFCLPNALRPRPGVVRMARGGSPDAPQGDLGPTWSRLGRPKNALGPSETRPGALLDASPGVRGASSSAPERPTTEFSRFFVVLGPIFIDPNGVFERFCVDSGIVEYRSAVPADTTLEVSSCDLTSMRSCKST